MFLDLLKLSKLKKKQLANILGVDPSTVTNWKDKAPKYVIAFLEVYISNEKFREQVKQYEELIAKAVKRDGRS